jgi:hydantoinase/carbamoylase family amidase
MDSVLGGGMFDGTAGLVAAAECARRIKEEKVPAKWNIHILATNGEEGNELGGTFGSRVMMGMVDTDNEEWMTKAGKFGFSRDDLEGARLDTSRAGAYLELHIEQGLTLEGHHEKIGIVEGIVGLQRHKIRIRGKNNHAGTTMMEDRDDALVKAARVILEADSLIRSYGHRMVATACRLELTPNAPAVINGQADILLEHRGLDSRLLSQYIEELARKTADPSISMVPVVKKEPVQCSGILKNIIEQVCRETQTPCRRMPSGATHDGNAMASAMPIGMIFVPSRGGISHSREEWTDWEDLSCGVQVMYDTLCRIISQDKISS